MRLTTKCCYCGASCLAKYGCCKKCGLKNSPRYIASLPETSIAKTHIDEEENRAIRSMYQGAQKALLRLQKEQEGIDFTPALKQCRERISELTGGEA